MNEREADAPRPRVLAVGLTEPEIEQIRPLAGTLDIEDTVAGVHADEYDVLIRSSSDYWNDADAFPMRIVFAPPVSDEDKMANTRREERSWASTLGRKSRATAQVRQRPARSLVVTPNMNEPVLARLVRSSCMPAEGAMYTMLERPIHPSRTELTLLEEKLESAATLAAIFEQHNEDSAERAADSVFWLPDIARSALADWVRAAFDRWRTQDPDTFPVTAEWRRADQWSSPNELNARGALAEFDAAEASRRFEVEEKRRELSLKVEAAEAAGEAWRALVSESGDGLVGAVKEALELIGFSATDSDALPENRGKKREDLRAQHDGWTALVEVKGYSGAAKSNDLQQLNGAATAYAAGTGSPADALWYVVNAHRELDPTQRETPMGSREEDLETFAEYSSGALIDTRELFAIRQLVATGQIAKDAARDLLIAARARFVAPREEPTA